MALSGTNTKTKFHRFVVRMTIVSLALQGFVLPFTPAEAVTQNAARWRNDDGTEAAATWAAAENAPITVDKGVTKRLRMGMANGGSDAQLKEKAMLEMQDGEDQLNVSAIDTVNGFAYYATGTRHARIIKVSLASFTKVGTLTLESVVGQGVYGMDIDTTNGFLYAAVSDVPSRIVKVNLSTFTVSSSLTLQTGDDYVYSAVVDEAANVGYFGTYTTPARVIKVNLATMTRVGMLTMDSGNGAIIDQGNLALDSGNAALYVTYWSAVPAKVTKISTASFTTVGTLAFNSGEDRGRDIAIDGTAGFGYVSTYQTPGKILKFSLSSFTRVDALTLNSGENYAMELEIDVSGGHLYAGLFTFPATIVKVNLGSFTRVGALTLITGDQGALSLSLDSGAGKGYLSTASIGPTVKFDLAALTRDAGLAPATETDVEYWDAQRDDATGMAYFCSATSPAQIVKVNTTTMARVSSVVLNPAEDYCYALEIDTVNGFGYATTYTSPAKVVKFNLSTMTRIGALTLSINSVDATSIDVTNGFLYVSNYASPVQVAKVDLGSFTETAAITLNAGENRAWMSSEIDVANQKLYVGTNTVPGKVVKINLSTFTREAVVTFNAGEDYALASGIDLTDQKLYVATDTDPANVIKIDLATFTRESAVAMNAGEMYPYAGVFDQQRDMFYFGTSDYSGQPRVTQVNVATMTRVASYETSDAHDLYDAFTAAVIDVTNGYAYFMTEFNAPSRLYKLSIVPRYDFQLEHAKKISTCAAATGWTAVGSGPWESANSSYLVDGSATTNVASGVTDGGAAFVPGQAKDAGSRTGEILVDGSTEFTEVEYSVRANVAAENGATYCFRTTNAGDTTGFAFTNYAEATLTGTYSPTSANKVTLSRTQASVSAVVTATFTLSAPLSGTLTVTFPAGFTVTSAATGPASSPCLSGFGFTASTLTATKTACSGTITLGGATVTNPASTGTYHISWVNDDPGGGDVVIVDSDQVTVSGAVDPQMTFNAGSQTAACDGTFTGAGGGLSLGAITTAAVATSDVSAVPHVCTRVTINGSGGAIVSVRSANAALQSTSTPADQIASATATLSAGSAGYGACVGSGGGDTGRDSTSPAGATPAAAAPFNGTCTTSNHSVGALTSSAQNLWTVSGASQNAFARIYVKASVSPATPAHADYADTLTFLAAGTY